MPKKKSEVHLSGNSTKHEVHERVINKMKDSNAFVFISIKGIIVSSAYSVDGATPEQILSLSKNVSDKALELINICSAALEKHEKENLGGVAPLGVS